MRPSSDSIGVVDPASGSEPHAADPSRSVLGRLDRVVGAFDDVDGVLTLHELTQRTELPKSTVHRMVDQLVQIGWLERDVDGYRVGMRLFEIGGLATRRRRLAESAAPHLHALSVDDRAGGAAGHPRRHRGGLPRTDRAGRLHAAHP